MPGKAKSDGKERSSTGRENGSTKASGKAGGGSSGAEGGKGRARQGESGGGASSIGSKREGEGREPKRRLGRSAVKETPPTPDPLSDTPPSGKKRTGRKSNAQKAVEEAALRKRERAQLEEGAKILAPYIEGVLPIPFDIIAKKRGEHWKLKSSETEKVSFALAIIIEKHMPDFMFAWQDEIMLAVLLGGVVAGRLSIDAKAKEERKAKKVETTDVSPSNHGDETHGQDNIDVALASGK